MWVATSQLNDAAHAVEIRLEFALWIRQIHDIPGYPSIIEIEKE